MDSILLVSSRLANLVSILFLVLLLAGLAMEARPEMFGWVRLVSTDQGGDGHSPGGRNRGHRLRHRRPDPLPAAGRPGR